MSTVNRTRETDRVEMIKQDQHRRAKSIHSAATCKQLRLGK